MLTPSNPQNAGGVKPPGSTPLTSNQAGTGNAAAASGGASAASGSGNVPTAGTRGAQAGAAARGGNGGQTSNDRDAGNGNADSGMSVPRDAGSPEPTEPEPTPDAGPQTPALPCNGTCPNDRPVCDETKTVPQCVQCTAQEQFACVGETRTCDVAQQKCVQCTPQDARNCADSTPNCNGDNRCVVCTADRPNSCPVAQPLCDNEQRCVECLPGRTEGCPSERTMCNADGRCVACMNDAQCLEAAKPRCDTQTNACVGCEGESDCVRFADRPICEEGTKACVACSPTGDKLCPVGNYCDRQMYQCVPGEPKQRSCEPCQNDRDCAESPSIAACIPQDNGRFCFTATIAVAPLCEPNFVAANVPGRADMYCTPLSSISCPAINNALNNKICTSANECGRGGLCPMPENICRLP
jgi:hypothetical protein